MFNSTAKLKKELSKSNSNKSKVVSASKKAEASLLKFKEEFDDLNSKIVYLKEQEKEYSFLAKSLPILKIDIETATDELDRLNLPSLNLKSKLLMLLKNTIK